MMELSEAIKAIKHDPAPNTYPWEFRGKYCGTSQLLAFIRQEVAQLEAKIKIMDGLDIKGLEIIATELAKTEPPYRWSSLWRDCGLRQAEIGKQLLRLCAKLGGES